MDWILGGTTIIMLWLMGNKSIWGPIFGTFSQGLWIYYTISTEQYGLLVGALVYLGIHIRNWIRWKEDKSQ